MWYDRKLNTWFSVGNIDFRIEKSNHLYMPKNKIHWAWGYSSGGSIYNNIM